MHNRVNYRWTRWERPGAMRRRAALGQARLWLYQAISDRITDQSGGLVNIEFFHYLGAVGIRRLGADTQQHRDFFGGMPFADQLQDLSFTQAQFSVGRIGVGKERTDHRVGD